MQIEGFSGRMKRNARSGWSRYRHQGHAEPEGPEAHHKGGCHPDEATQVDFELHTQSPAHEGRYPRDESGPGCPHRRQAHVRLSDKIERQADDTA